MPFGNKAPILPIVLGLSIAGVGAALLYMWLKKKDDETEPLDGLNVQRKTITLNIKNDLAPVVIGKSGATLRDIEHKSGAKIYFKELDDHEMLCVISGSDEETLQAKELVESIIAGTGQIKTSKMWVPHSACGRIIGRCGENITEINKLSQAKVVIDPPVASTPQDTDPTVVQQRRVTITGTAQQIATAQVLIQEKVEEDAELRHSLDESLSKREPRNPSIVTQNSNKDIIIPQREKLLTAGTDGTMEVYVSAVCNPSKFWLQLLGPQATALDNLVDQMTDYYNKDSNRQMHIIHKPEVGQIVAAMFNYDNKWYRAQVQAIQPSDFVPCQPVLDLYFVDYGDNAFVAPQEVYELRTDFLTLRFQAIECFLANVKPPSPKGPKGDTTSQDWARNSISRFEELTKVANWKKLWSRVVTYKERETEPTIASSRTRREGSPIPGVELYDSVDGRDINIGEELALEGLACIVNSRENSPGAFGDLGRSRVLAVTPKLTPESKTLDPITPKQTTLESKISEPLSPKPKITETKISEPISQKPVTPETKIAESTILEPKPSVKKTSDPNPKVSSGQFVKNEKALPQCIKSNEKKFINETKDFIANIATNVNDMPSKTTKETENLKLKEDFNKQNNLKFDTNFVPNLKIDASVPKLISDSKVVPENSISGREKVDGVKVTTESTEKVKDKSESTLPVHNVDFMPTFSKSPTNNITNSNSVTNSLLNSERNGHTPPSTDLGKSGEWTEL